MPLFAAVLKHEMCAILADRAVYRVVDCLRLSVPFRDSVGDFLRNERNFQ